MNTEKVWVLFKETPMNSAKGKTYTVYFNGTVRFGSNHFATITTMAREEAKPFFSQAAAQAANKKIGGGWQVLLVPSL